MPGTQNTVTDSSKNNIKITTDTSEKNGTDVNQTTVDALNSLFSQSNVLLVVIFLAIYFVLYFGLGNFFNSDQNPVGSQLMLSRLIDFLIIGFFIFFLISYYVSLSTYDKEHTFVYILKWVKDFWNDPKSIIELMITTVIFYMMVYLCRVPMTEETKPFSIGFIEGNLWVFIAIQLILDFFKYVLNIRIIDIIFGDSLVKWSDNPPVDASKNIIPVDVSSNIVPLNEVFNISNNLYTYDDAQAICSAYDAKLATYDQVEDSYNNGGEWCNYGWSDGRMALFPTQKHTWDNLQKTDNHKNDCGRPGVNGGVISNPYIKFGVNCYGKKPKATDKDLLGMEANKNIVYPKTMKDAVLDAKVKFWKDHAAEMLNISSYNKKKWSEY